MKKFSQEEVEKIIDLYLTNKLSFSTIGKLYGCIYSDIKQLLLLNKVKIRTREEDIALKTARYNQTCLNKYGVINVSQSSSIKNKKVETYKKHFGVDNYNKTAASKLKHKQTCLKKYGVDNPSKVEAIKQKKIEKVKVIDPTYTNVFQLKATKEKIKQTCLTKFGTKNPQQNLEVRAKTKKTNVKKYGVACCLLNDKIKQKSANTCIKKYGVAHYSQTKEFHSKSVRKYIFNAQMFDSLPELAVYIYAIDKNWSVERLPIKLEYYFSNNIHYYFPDFRINNKLVEIKNDYLYKKMLIHGSMENAKLLCIKANNVDLWLPKKYKFAIDYCILKYGKNFKELFKAKNSTGGDAHV